MITVPQPVWTCCSAKTLQMNKSFWLSIGLSKEKLFLDRQYVVTEGVVAVPVLLTIVISTIRNVITR